MEMKRNRWIHDCFRGRTGRTWTLGDTRSFKLWFFVIFSDSVAEE